MTAAIYNTGGQPAQDGLLRLFLAQLALAYNAAHQRVQALPAMASAASRGKLKRAFELEWSRIVRRIERLERVFDRLGGKPPSRKCQAMEGLIRDSNELLETVSGPRATDTAARCATRIELDEYRSLLTLSQALGDLDSGAVFCSAIEEEIQAVERLDALAKTTLMPDTTVMLASET